MMLAGWKKKVTSGNSAVSSRRSSCHVLLGRPVALGFSEIEDLAVAGPDRGGVAVGEVDAAERQPDVVQDRLEFVRRDSAADARPRPG